MIVVIPMILMRMFHVEHSGFKVQGSKFKIQAWTGDCSGKVDDLIVGVMFHVEHSVGAL